MPEIRRKVYFYKVRVDPERDGTVRPFDPTQANAMIGALPFTTATVGGQMDRYLNDIDDTTALCVWPSPGGTHQRMRLGLVRRADLPRLEDTGNVRPLAIQAHQGILEETHIVFFPQGIVGAEFNFFGPRLGRLEHYLKVKAPTMPRVHFDLLAQRHMLDQVKRMRDARSIRLRVHQQYADLLRHASESLPDAFSQNRSFLVPPVLEITWRVERYAREGLGHRALEVLLRLVGEEKRVREGVEVFQVEGLARDTGKVELFDLLKDKLVSTQSVIRRDERYRGVDSASMFAAIEESHTKLHAALVAAIGIET